MAHERTGRQEEAGEQNGVRRPERGNRGGVEGERGADLRPEVVAERDEQRGAQLRDASAFDEIEARNSPGQHPRGGRVAASPPCRSKKLSAFGYVADGFWIDWGRFTTCCSSSTPAPRTASSCMASTILSFAGPGPGAGGFGVYMPQRTRTRIGRGHCLTGRSGGRGRDQGQPDAVGAFHGPVIVGGDFTVVGGAKCAAV